MNKRLPQAAAAPWQTSESAALREREFPQSWTKAVEWCERGDGKGLAANRAMAMHWLQQSAHAGYPEAHQAIIDIETRGWSSMLSPLLTAMGGGDSGWQDNSRSNEDRERQQQWLQSRNEENRRKEEEARREMESAQADEQRRLLSEPGWLEGAR